MCNTMHLTMTRQKSLGDMPSFHQVHPVWKYISQDLIPLAGLLRGLMRNSGGDFERQSQFFVLHLQDDPGYCSAFAIAVLSSRCCRRVPMVSHICCTHSTFLSKLTFVFPARKRKIRFNKQILWFSDPTVHTFIYNRIWLYLSKKNLCISFDYCWIDNIRRTDIFNVTSSHV